MKPAILLLTLLGLVVPAVAQTEDPTVNDPTVVALKALLPLKDQACFGTFLQSSHTQAKFGSFLGMQGRFALLADKETLVRLKKEADRPNYRGNANARIKNNFWLAILEGRVSPPPATPAPPAD